MSVVVPAHDAHRTLARAVRSVQAQTVPVAEIVVVDDHSTDGTAALVAEMARADARITLVRATRRGAGHARNAGVAAAAGEVVAFLDADDVWYPDKLEHQLPLLTDDVAFVGALVHYLGEDGSVLGSYLPFDDWDEATASLRRAETMPVSMAFSVLRREVFLAAGGFDETFLRTQDLELGQRMVADGRRRVVWPKGRALGGYVLHRGGVSATSYEEQFLAAELVRARVQGRSTAGYAEWLADPVLAPSARRALRSGAHYRQAAVARGRGEDLGVLRHGVAALAVDPGGVVRKLRRRGRHAGVLTPAGPPPEVLSGFSPVGRPSAHGDDEGSPLERLPAATVAGLRLVEDPWQLADAAVREQVADPRTRVLLAAHVTSLNQVGESAFARAFNRADGAYVDGVSWSLVAAAGGDRVHKAATTDLAPYVIGALAETLGRPVRVAVLGGERAHHHQDTVAARAGRALEETLPVRVVQASHGYHLDWGHVLRETRRTEPDLVLVGLGMPNEAYWTRDHRSQLPPALVLTCGGWLRILAGDEHRAPDPVVRMNLEWLHRLVTDPGRTFQRYALGTVNLARYSGAALLGRLWRGDR